MLSLPAHLEVIGAPMGSSLSVLRSQAEDIRDVISEGARGERSAFGNIEQILLELNQGSRDAGPLKDSEAARKQS